jgi:hypothetical protein
MNEGSTQTGVALLCDDGTACVNVSDAQLTGVLEALERGGINPTRREQEPGQRWLVHFAPDQEVTGIQVVLEDFPA